jgi:hypothetical protein
MYKVSIVRNNRYSKAKYNNKACKVKFQSCSQYVYQINIIQLIYNNYYIISFTIQKSTFYWEKTLNDYCKTMWSPRSEQFHTVVYLELLCDFIVLQYTESLTEPVSVVNHPVWWASLAVYLQYFQNRWDGAKAICSVLVCCKWHVGQYLPGMAKIPSTAVIHCH